MIRWKGLWLGPTWVVGRVGRDGRKEPRAHLAPELNSWRSLDPGFEPFVPPLWQGFRLLLASPTACLQLFQELKEKGYGEAAQFDGECL